MKHSTSSKPDIYRLLEFQKLLLQFVVIERRNQVPPNFRRENDTEHSYNLALTAWFLSTHFPELDRDKLIRLALAHDLIEIYAGDTYVYGDQSAVNAKKDREAAALRRLEDEWPDFPDLMATIAAYERRDSPEARFIYALDKIMPIMLNFLGEGHTWQQEGLTRDRLHEVKRDKVALSKEINEYYEQLYRLLADYEHYFAKS